MLFGRSRTVTPISTLEDQVGPLPSLCLLPMLLTHCLAVSFIVPTLLHSHPVMGTKVLFAVYCAAEGVRGLEEKSG